MNQIPPIFESQDLIFHYCSAQVAFEYILYEKKIRLSPRFKSKDPIENQKPTFVHSSSGKTIQDHEQINEKTNELATRLENDINIRINQSRQICFCMNDRSEKYNAFNPKPLEYYGFLRPRMWDQYGDEYNGVCLAFSINELKKNNGFLFKEVEYVNYASLGRNQGVIRRNQLLNEKYEKIRNEQFEKLERQLFQKHEDYRGENEFRIATYSEREYEYIPIEESLKGIIISDEKMSAFAREMLLNYANDMGIEVRRIAWRNNGVMVISNEEIQNIVKQIRAFT